MGHGQAPSQLRRGVNMPDWAWGIAAWVATAAGTGLARKYALHRQLLDQPGERRNHQVPTPRGGGIAMLVVLLVIIAASGWLYPSNLGAMSLLWVSLALVGGVGWWDDHRPLSAALRLTIHAMAAGCLFLAGLLLDWPLWSLMGGAIAAMALINIWNFMDGIDGLAASQAVVVCAVMGLVLGMPWSAFGFAVAGAAFGFLLWNFPNARIFMGDVGSGVLGISVAWAWTASAAIDPMNGALMLFPLAPFLIDSTLTLALRLRRRERWWEAHSSHTYQLLARRIGRHTPVTMAYLGATLLGAGMAWWGRHGGGNPAFIWLGLMAWYTALVIIWKAVRTSAKE